MRRALAAKLRGLFGDRRAERDLDEEIKAHLRLLTERYVSQGMTEAEAARAARALVVVRFGAHRVRNLRGQPTRTEGGAGAPPFMDALRAVELQSLRIAISENRSRSY